MSYTDPNSVHVPATGAAIPAAWGTTVATDLNDLNTRANITKIAETILGASAASVTFSSIPGTFRHLMIEYQARVDAAATTVAVNIRFNGDTGANYDFSRISVTGTGAPADLETIATASAFIGLITAASAPANVAGAGEIKVPNYAGTTFQKEAVGTSGTKTANSAGNTNQEFARVWWRNAAAINTIALLAGTGNFIAGSTFTLYGLA